MKKYNTCGEKGFFLKFSEGLPLIYVDASRRPTTHHGDAGNWNESILNLLITKSKWSHHQSLGFF